MNKNKIEILKNIDKFKEDEIPIMTHLMIIDLMETGYLKRLEVSFKPGYKYYLTEKGKEVIKEEEEEEKKELKATGKQNILVIAAHMDDESLGCGGYIKKLVWQGHNVTVRVLSESVSSRFKEEFANGTMEAGKEREKCYKKACEVLGVEIFHCSDFTDNRFDGEDLLNIIKDIERYIDEHQPDTILTHYEHDLNIDHQITARATMTACRPGKNSVKKILQYEVLSSTELAEIPFKPNYFVDITETIESKINACLKYDEEMTGVRSRENLITLAKYRGLQSGHEFSEAYIIKRWEE